MFCKSRKEDRHLVHVFFLSLSFKSSFVRKLQKMSRARQAQTSTPAQQPPQPQAAHQQPESMDIMAQAMTSLSPGHEVGQEFPQGTPYIAFPQGMRQQCGGPNSFQTGQDPSFNLNDAFQRISLQPKEYVCEFYEKEVVHKKGIVFQYINTNSTGATTAVGVTRINVTDPRKVPQYISRNLATIRQHAVSALQIHMRHTLCAAGILEKLTHEDFSISFSWASLTDAGRSLCLPGRSDLALGYAACDNLLMPILLSREDPFPTYVVNVHIYLLDLTRRSTAVLAKAREEAAQRNNPDRVKYVKKPQGNNNGYSERQLVNLADMAANRAVQNTELKRAAPTLFDHFPPLPAGPAPEWNISGKTPLPDE